MNIRILKKEKEMTDLFINNLVEEVKMVRQQNRELEKTLNGFLLNKYKNPSNPSTPRGKTHLGESVKSFVDDVMNDSLVASK